MALSLDFFTWIPDYVKAWFRKEEQRVAMKREGVTIIVTEDHNKARNVVQKLLSRYNEEGHALSLSFTDVVSHGHDRDNEDNDTTTNRDRAVAFDATTLDSWVMKRAHAPESVTYVLINYVNDHIYNEEALRNLLEQQELLNVAVYIVMPIKHLRPSFVKQHATRIVLNLTPRKVSALERQQLYDMAKHVTKVSWITSWLNAYKRKESLVLEDGHVSIL